MIVMLCWGEGALGIMCNHLTWPSETFQVQNARPFASHYSTSQALSEVGNHVMALTGEYIQIMSLYSHIGVCFFFFLSTFIIGLFP